MRNRATKHLPQDRPLEEKWGPALVDGYVVIPTALLKRLKELGVSAADYSVIPALLSFWHKTDMPFVSIEKLAERCPQTKSNVRKRLASLEKLGLIRRIYRKNRSSEFDLRPLVLAANGKSLGVQGNRKRVPTSAEASGQGQSVPSGIIDPQIVKSKRAVQSFGEIMKERYGQSFSGYMAIVLLKSLIISVMV
jgi:DNA-binding Lrp family transcriptional regulator